MPVKNRLKKILDDRGIKQTWLAEKVEVTRGTISNIINNRYNTTLDLAFKISIALNMDLNDVFYYDENND